MTRPEPQADRLHRKTTEAEKPVLWIMAIILVVGFNSGWGLGFTTVVVVVTVIATYTVNKMADSVKKKLPQPKK